MIDLDIFRGRALLLFAMDAVFFFILYAKAKSFPSEELPLCTSYSIIVVFGFVHALATYPVFGSVEKFKIKQPRMDTETGTSYVVVKVRVKHIMYGKIAAIAMLIGGPALTILTLRKPVIADHSIPYHDR